MKGFVKLLTVCVILPICLAGQSAPEKHSLYYVYTALSKAVNAPGIFEFSAMGLLDDRKIDYYNSQDKKKIPEQNWMKEKLPADYWEKGTQSRRSKEQWFKVNVNILMDRMRDNQSDIHVLMWRHGCEVHKVADGSVRFVRGVDEYSYDGKDFLSFDDASMQWIAPVRAAEATKQKWDGVPILNQYTKGYLEKECVDWLDKFRTYGNKELKQLVEDSPPDIRLFAKEKTSPYAELICMATGFYPKEIDITILKGDKVIKKGRPEEVLPNGDGTHQIRLSVEAKKSDLNDYGCEVKHIAQTNGVKKVWEFDGELLCPPQTNPVFTGTLGVLLGLLLGVPIVLGILVAVAVAMGYIVFENGRPRSNFRRQRPVEVAHVHGNGVANGHGPAANGVAEVPLLVNGNGVPNGNGVANGHGPAANGVAEVTLLVDAAPNGN